MSNEVVIGTNKIALLNFGPKCFFTASRGGRNLKQLRTCISMMKLKNTHIRYVAIQTSSPKSFQRSFFATSSLLRASFSLLLFDLLFVRSIVALLISDPSFAIRLIIDSISYTLSLFALFFRHVS